MNEVGDFLTGTSTTTLAFCGGLRVITTTRCPSGRSIINVVDIPRSNFELVRKALADIEENAQSKQET